VVLARLGGKHADVGDRADGQHAQPAAGAGGVGRVDGDHAPQLLVGEVAAEAVAVPLVGAGQLAQKVGRAAVGPVGPRAIRPPRRWNSATWAVMPYRSMLERADQIRVAPSRAMFQ
jgi:hypothetical protein